MIIYAQQCKRRVNDGLMQWRFIIAKLALGNGKKSNPSSNITPYIYKKKIGKGANVEEEKNISTIKSKEITTRGNNNTSIDQSNIIQTQSEGLVRSPSFTIEIANVANFCINDTHSAKGKTKGKALTISTNGNKSIVTTTPGNCRQKVKENHTMHLTSNNTTKSNSKSIGMKRDTSLPKIEPKLTLSKKEKEELFTSLYNDSKQRKEKLRQLSLEKEQKFNTTYTFTPKMVSSRGKSAGRYRYHEDFSFLERLQTYHQSRKHNLKKIEQEVIDSIPKPKQCKKPIESHLIPTSQDYNQNKKEKMRQIENTMRQEQGITFKPSLNDSINSLIPSSVIERNEEFIKQKEAKLSAHREDTECTFKPKINDNLTSTTRVTEQGDDTQQQAPQIGQRLYQYQSKYLQNLEEKKMLYQQSYPFKPTLSKNTNEILQNKQKIMDELRKRYDNNINEITPNRGEHDGIIEESTPKETDDNQVNYKINTINDFSSDNGDSITPHGQEEAYQSDRRYKIDSLGSLSDEHRRLPMSTAKDSISKTKGSSNGDNLTDEKLLELAKNYITVDESLEKFQMKYKHKLGMKNGSNNSNAYGKEVSCNGNANNHNAINSKPSTISEERDISEKDSDIKQPKKNALMKNLNYYNNLC